MDFGYIQPISQKAVVLGTLHVCTDFAKESVPIVSGTTLIINPGKRIVFNKAKKKGKNHENV